MSIRAAVVVAGVISAMAAASASPERGRRASLGGTVWDGVYTEAQAKRGEKVYAATCVKCHLDTFLGDGTATALTGPGFLANWDGVLLGEMVDRTRSTMPDDDPGTLSRQQVADVLAFVLKFNKFPAGDTELPTQAEALNQIKFLATKAEGTQ